MVTEEAIRNPPKKQTDHHTSLDSAINLQRESFVQFLWIVCEKCVRPWVSFLIEAIDLLAWFWVRKSTEEFWDIHAGQ